MDGKRCGDRRNRRVEGGGWKGWDNKRGRGATPRSTGDRGVEEYSNCTYVGTRYQRRLLAVRSGPLEHLCGLLPLLSTCTCVFLLTS